MTKPAAAFYEENLEILQTLGNCAALESSWCSLAWVSLKYSALSATGTPHTGVVPLCISCAYARLGSSGGDNTTRGDEVFEDFVRLLA